MKHLTRPWTASNEWLLKEAATLLFERFAHSIRNRGSGIVETLTLSENSRLVTGRVDLTELRQLKKRRIRVCYQSLDVAFVIDSSDRFWPIGVDIEWIDDPRDTELAIEAAC